MRAKADARRLAQIETAPDAESRQRLYAQREQLLAKAAWIEQTIIEIIISEAQNEVANFKKWDFDIIPHRSRKKQGFETPDSKRVDVESAFKKPGHPFRVAIVCAMWLTGFDVEFLSTLYIDKPMRAHTLMQAIARANRRFRGKDFGLIVDYNGMLKALRETLAQYALGDDGNDKLRDEFAKKIKHKATVLQDIFEILEQKLARMPAANLMRIDYYKKYQEIIADYNRDKDRITIEETFARVTELITRLDEEQRRTVEEGLSEEQLALFDLIQRGDLSKAERDKVKDASRELLAEILSLIGPLDQWTEKEQTQAEVKTFILDHIYQTLPEPLYSLDDKQHVAELVYRHVWQQSVSGRFPHTLYN